MTKWTAPDIASIRGDNSRPLQKIFASLSEHLKDYQNGYTLNSLDDVTITTPSVGQVLSYDATNSLWINTTGSVITNLNASNLASGTVPAGRLAGGYFGITGVGTLTTGSIPATLLTGTVPTGRVSGSYAGITSVGTLGSLTITGDLTVDTNTLRVDSTNNRVGIGTVSPTTTLRVAGTTQITGSNTFPTTGVGIEIVPGAAGGTNLIQAYSRDASTWQHLAIATGLTTFSTNGIERMRMDSSNDVIISGSLRLSASTNAYVSYANTPDTAMPWMQGPTFQGQTGWAFYQQVTGSYRMGFRSGSSGATRYMWCADNTLLGSAPDDAQMTTTLNVIGNMRTTAGYYGTVTYGSYGSLSIYGENGNYVGITFPNHSTTWMSATNGQIFGIYRNNNTWNFYVSNGTFVPSDERYKRDIEPLQHGMNLIREIVPVTYDPLTEDPSDDPEQTVGRTHYGFTTQNILQALANVGETRDIAMVDIGGPDSAMNSDRQYLNHSALIAPMVKAIQELDQRLQQLETV